jgi:uncharacterized membrane protein YgdD (TMEM256/DUF423 family)
MPLASVFQPLYHSSLDSLHQATIMHRPFLFVSALAALLAVAFGAFGAHGLKGHLDETRLTIYQTAVDYQMWHALGLGLIGLLVDRFPDQWLLRWAGWLMLGGIVLFSGSLYLLSLAGWSWMGIITPLGGMAFLTAWSVLAVVSLRLQGRRS